MGHLNVFQFCTGLKIIGSFMILVVLSIVALSYHAVVLSSYGPDLAAGGWHTAVAVLVLVLFHSLLVMLLWSYFATVLSDPGGVPEDWSPYTDHMFDLEAAEKADLGGNPGLGESGSENEANALLMSTGEAGGEQSTGTGPTAHAGSGSESILPAGGADPGSLVGRDHGEEMVAVRRCKKCLHYKPPRTHHCSVCRRCILKMDHHCVWVVNCVGARNYKSFILFMVYTCLESTLVAVSLLPKFVEFFGPLEGDVGPDETVNLLSIFMAFILNFAFMLSLMGFLALHVSLVLGNTTTIEAFEKTKAGSKWRYDMGRQRNIEQVFGRDKRYWFIPCYSPEDLKSMPELSGLQYPCKSEPERPVSQQLTAAHALDLD